MLSVTDTAFPAGSGRPSSICLSPMQSDRERIAIGELTLNKCDRTVWFEDRVIPLTRREFAVLWCLASHPGRVVERREFLEKAWGPGEFVEPRTVDAHVVKVRRKLEACGVSGLRIETIWGTGYRLQADKS